MSDHPTIPINMSEQPDAPQRRGPSRGPKVAIAVIMLVVLVAAGLLIWRSVSPRHTAAAAQASTPAASPSPHHLTPLQINLQVLEQNVNSPGRTLQGLALVPTRQIVPGGSMTHPGLSGIKFDARTFRQSGHFGLVQATDAQGRVYSVGLYRDKNDWLIYGTRPGPLAKTASARPANPNPVAQAGLVAYQHPEDSSSCLPDVGTRLPVVLVHGFMSSAAVWGSLSDQNSMLGILSRIPGTDIATFDYSSSSKSWVDNSAIGPALARTIKCYAQASARAGGPGKVLVVAHSMGGLAVRWAATNGGAGDDIGKLITIGTPNLGSAWANVADPVMQALCGAASSVSLYGPHGSLCPDVSALRGLSEFSSQIQGLSWLPSNIGVTAIGGDLSIGGTVFGANVVDNTLSDFIVGENSALQNRNSGNGSELVVSCTMTPTQLSAPCWHKALPSDPQVEQATATAIRAYLSSLPSPAPSVTPTPTPTAPSPTATPTPSSTALAGAWLGDDGQWYVHGSKLQLAPSGSGLSGSMSWSVGPCNLPWHPFKMCQGLADMTVTLQADGSLKLVYRNVRYVSNGGSPNTYGYHPDQSLPQNGQDFRLVQLQPHLARVVPDGHNSPGFMQPGHYNPYMCQADLGTFTRTLKCGIL